MVFVGPQLGGVSVAQFLGLHAKELNARYACAEKKITQLKNENQREQSLIQFVRHTIRKGDRVIITEDVLNNFSTTHKVIAEIEKAGGEVICICGLLNRSEKHQNSFEYKHEQIPVIGLVSEPFPEYEQVDERVATDIANGNVIWKPKDDWKKLMDAMEGVIA